MVPGLPPIQGLPPNHILVNVSRTAITKRRKVSMERSEVGTQAIISLAPGLPPAESGPGMHNEILVICAVG